MAHTPHVRSWDGRRLLSRPPQPDAPPAVSPHVRSPRAEIPQHLLDQPGDCALSPTTPRNDDPAAATQAQPRRHPGHATTDPPQPSPKQRAAPAGPMKGHQETALTAGRRVPPTPREADGEHERHQQADGHPSRPTEPATRHAQHTTRSTTAAAGDVSRRPCRPRRTPMRKAASTSTMDRSRARASARVRPPPSPCPPPEPSEMIESRAVSERQACMPRRD